MRGCGCLARFGLKGLMLDWMCSRPLVLALSSPQVIVAFIRLLFAYRLSRLPYCFCRPSAAVSAEPLANSSANGHPQTPPVQSNRALVKGALKLLAESDDLVQVIVQELEKSGLLTKPASL